MTPDIVMVGYYGNGNFGDDVLTVVTHNLLRRLQPTARIGVRLPSGRSYLANLIEDEITPVEFGTRDEHRLIVHGGGGNFFDFQNYRWPARFRNAILLAGGAAAFNRVENSLRHWTGRMRMSARTRVGFGLGIGTFTPGSPRLLQALPVLADFKRLWVRDSVSRTNLSGLGLATPAVVGSDLAFLYDHWCPPELVLSTGRTKGARPRLGLVLRDWPVHDGAAYADRARHVLDGLAAQFDVTVFSFDVSTDSRTLAILRTYPTIMWQPDRRKIHEFASSLAAQDVLVTARAHAAICGACMGRPSVIIDIEPKLTSVHAMLPRTTRIVPPDASLGRFRQAINEILEIQPSIIAEEVDRNKLMSEAALATVMESIGS